MREISEDKEKEEISIVSGAHSYTLPIPPLCARERTKTNSLNLHSTKINKNSTHVPETCTHYFTLAIIGVLIWGTLWCGFGDTWRWDGWCFKTTAIAIVAWALGQLLESVTTLPPLLAALLTGILARNLGLIDMPDRNLETFLRKIYPVVILGKASLSWDVDYMKKNWLRVGSLGMVPWLTEVITAAVCAHVLLNFPWNWSFLLGSVYASTSCAIVMPSVQKIGAGARNWPQLICTAGGVDTALSVGVFGIVQNFIPANNEDIFTYIKASSTLVCGVTLGILWGSIARVAPHSLDVYVAELRLLFVLFGGIFTSFLTAMFGWGGLAGVAVLACNATAATNWTKSGWKLNKNPVSTAYRVMWSTLEPMLFAYTGSYFVINETGLSNTLTVGFQMLLICLTVRLTVTFLVCWDFTLPERLFVCTTWIPKSIVEAVLCPLPLIAVLSNADRDMAEAEYSRQLLRIIIQAILLTTPIGYILPRVLGPVLLNRKRKINDVVSQPEIVSTP